MKRPLIMDVRTDRERELAAALRHAIEWIEETTPGQDTGWYRNVLADALWPSEKSLADVSEECGYCSIPLEVQP